MMHILVCVYVLYYTLLNGIVPSLLKSFIPEHLGIYGGQLSFCVFVALPNIMVSEFELVLKITLYLHFKRSFFLHNFFMLCAFNSSICWLSLPMYACVRPDRLLVRPLTVWLALWKISCISNSNPCRRAWLKCCFKSFRDWRFLLFNWKEKLFRREGNFLDARRVFWLFALELFRDIRHRQLLKIFFFVSWKPRRNLLDNRLYKNGLAAELRKQLQPVLI